ncbi:outer membrane protein TolC [Flavobacterium sp. 7E]|uniref:TolC family protein n=1 Tax=Flavobacterium sp. 7E TaxID=2735898 RepID=UPI00156E70E3|nr:TolC family protein [Flavobacterium sp. 7E]NRS87396.1 outer membrane protein TolC [Flavobacterium sp. 7E]
MKQILILFLFLGAVAFGQVSNTNNSKEFTYNEFLGYVKKYHPLVKTANLEINKAQANLMMARGGFDPKIEVDFKEKQFKDKEYYSILNSSFKIPTWYGIEIKAGFDNNDGIYLNPENTVPNKGLTSLGITVPLGQGLFINQRMADVRKAKIQMQLSLAERKLQAISVLYDASIAYFNWRKTFNEVKLYETYNANAQIRFNGIKSLIKAGDKRAIDSIEAGISVKNRILSLENSKLKLTKAKLELANFLWLDNAIPFELSELLLPEKDLDFTIQETLKTNDLIQNEFTLENHPKINALENKIEILTVEKKLKANMLLPKIDVGYSYIAEPSYIDDYQFENYKIGLNFYFPLFLRKERGSLKLAQYKIQESEFALNLERFQLSNKISAQKTEIQSLAKQNAIVKTLASDYSLMLKSEERLFSFGESSLFLINSRENSLISAQLASIDLENNYFVSNAALFKIMANPD